MRSLALGKIPQGYNLDESPHLESRAELCAQPDIAFGLGQKLNGTAINILVMKAENKGASPKLLDETACVSQDVLAVAAWPKIRLEPREKTEVYVAVRMDDPGSTEENRPSLIDR
jgi:conjugal transfer pilus assembly protein TraK